MTILLVACLVFAFLNWIAVAIDHRRLEYLAKPATLIFLILWFGTRLPSSQPALGMWFLTGLMFSLAGDVFLMLPGNHFLKGLVAFLLAHVAYIIAFNLTGLVISMQSLWIALAIILVAGIIMRRLVTSLRTSGRTSMIAPVIAYAIVLSLTFWSAANTTLRPDWPPLAGFLAVLGGALFFFSDAAIAWNRFVGPHPGGRLFEMITYHLAQISLSLAVLMAISTIP